MKFGIRNNIIVIWERNKSIRAKAYYEEPVILTQSAKSYIKGEFGGCILIDEAGNETHYSPEEWRHKEIMNKLDKLIQVLTKKE